MTAQSQTIQLIPLNRLSVSPDNVRRTDRKADIEALAASIASHGLLQNLSVTAGEGDRFCVVAGGRRLAALNSLAKAGVIARDFPVPCRVVPLEAGREASLVENVHRIAMHAIDEVEAFAALVEGGATRDEIAHRFGVTGRLVDQRLGLAGLSPKIKAACKCGDVSLDAARAFCLVEDHARQDAVFRSLEKPVTNAAAVRARLMEGRMRGADRLVAFIGLDAYEAAGGRLARDLFEEEAIYIEDPALVHKLAEEKLDALRPAYLAAGWGWVEVSIGATRIDGLASARLQPELRDPTAEEACELARLRAQLEDLDDALDRDSVEDDPRWDQRDDIAAAIERVRQSARVFDPEMMALAGVVLSVSHDGEMDETLGAIRQSDEKIIRAMRRRKAGSDAGQGGASACAKAALEPGSGLPRSLIRDLSAARTRALRLAVSRDQRTALALTVAAMACRSFLRVDLGGVAVGAHPARIDDVDDMAAAWSAVEDGFPADEQGMLDWCLAQTPERLLSVMAIMVAGAIDLTHERGSPADRRRQAVADRLAQAVRLDMTRYWTADIDFWTRLSKADLLSSLSDAPGFQDMTDAAREAALRAHARLKKEELAAKVCEAFSTSAYLPDLLVTPAPAGDLVLTEAGTEAAAA